MTRSEWVTRRDLSCLSLKLFLFEGVDKFDGGGEFGRACGGARWPGRRSPWRDASCPCRSRRRHSAGILASEETIYYAFHPLAGRAVATSGRRVVFGGDVHLTIRLADGTLTLTPEWMLRPAAAACEIRTAPRLCLARLRDLRAYLDAVLGSDRGDLPLTDGADHAPETPTTGPVRESRRACDRSRTNAAGRWWRVCERFSAEALSQKVSASIRKEARHEPDRG